MERPPSERIVILSPHRDDAAFSCGVLLTVALNSCPALIVNIFSRSGYAPFTPLIEARGLAAVTALRSTEDEAFLEALCTTARAPVTLIDLDLVDAPWRLHLETEDVLRETLSPSAYQQQVAGLATVLAPHLAHSPCTLLPLALGGTGLQGHLDHRIVRDAALRCAPPATLAFYEDSPYAARMQPQFREHAIAQFSAAYNLAPVHVCHPQAASLKSHHSLCYLSQVAPSTVAEMSAYTAQRSGELLYAAPAAHRMLKQLVTSAAPKDPA